MTRTIPGAMSLSSPPEFRIRLYEVRYRCAGESGKRDVWAPSDRSASRVLREHPSKFGLPHETVVVTGVREIRLPGRGRAA